MAYQDDFRNKVLAALKAKNLAVDISEEATQKAIVQEVQNVAKSESRPMSPEEMKLVLQDVATQLNNEKQQAFSAQSADFTAYGIQGGGGPGASYSGGGIAVSVMNKDILIIPTAGTATSINTLSQIDFKIISNPNAYGVIDPNEVKSSLYNWGERISGNTFDTPVLGLGGAWGGVSYTPTSQWGIGGSQGSGVGGSINTERGFGQVIYFKPATSSVYASIFNDIGLDTSFTNRNITLTGYQQPVPGTFPTAGFAVTFGGIGNSGDLVFHGAISEAQTNTIKFLSPLTISNATVTDLITLGLSSATSTVQNFVGGGTAQYSLSTTTSSFVGGDLFYASGSGHVTLTKLAIGGNNTFLTSNGSVPSWTSSITANTVAANAATGSTVLYPLMNNSTNSGVAISYDVDFNIDPSANILRFATGSFYVGTAVSSPTFTSSTSLVIKPGANATTAIALQKADGTNIFVVDTTNNRIGINMTPGSFALDVTGSANLSSSNAYNIAGTSVLNATTLGSAVVSSSLTSVGIISSGTWSGSTITTNYGGTGFATYAIGDILYANTVNTLAKRAAVATGSVLASQGVDTAPVYVATSTLSVGTAVTANNLNLATGLASAQHTLLFSQTATGTGIAISTNTTISFNPSNFILSTSGLAVTNTTATTSTTSGALIVSGGLGLAGNAFIGGTVFVPSATPSNFSNLLVSNTTATTSTTSGALVVSGGLGLAGNAFIGGTVFVPSTTPSNFSNLLVSNTTATTSNTSGALVVSGGLGLAGNAFIGGTINVPSTSTSNISNVTFANGIVTAGTWQGSAIATTYGGTGSNLGGNSANANKIVVLGSAASGYAATLIDGASTGRLLAAQGNGSAPTFVNTTDSAFTFNSGTLTINNAAITTGTITGSPTNANDLVNKSYADSISGGLDPHASVRLTTISAIGGSYRQAGTAGTLAGFGDYIIATTPAELLGVAVGFDTPTAGIALTHGQRVLVKDGVLGGYASGAGAYGAYPTTYGGFAASWVANGIYTVAAHGGAATSGWLLVRATDTDNQSGVQELTGGAFTFVEEGTNYADNAFVCTNDTTSLGPIGFGSTQIAWSPFSGGASLTAGQGLSKTGNTIATNFNLSQATSVNANLSNGFNIGGARSGSVGSSSYATWVVTGAAALSTNTLTANTIGFTLAGGQTNTSLVVAGVAANNTITGAADGWTHAGGTAARTLTVTGSDITLTGGGNTLTLASSSITLTGGGNTLTLSSSSTLNLNSQSLTLSASSGNLTFTGSAGNATTQNIVTSGTAQYQLSTATSTFAAGDMYYNTGATFAAMTRLVLGSGAGSSVLIRSDTAPVWGTIQLGSANFVSGQLGLSNGGTNNNLTAVTGAVAYSDASKIVLTNAGTAGSVLISNGTNPLFSAINLASSNAVTGTLPVTNGGTGAATFTLNGILYGNTTSAIQVTAAAANAILVTNGSNVPSLSTDIPTAVTIGGAAIYRVGGTDVSLADGGTNNSLTAVTGAVAYSDASKIVLTNAGTAGSVLISNGTNPLFSAINLASSNAVTGVLPIANGGSNATSANFTSNGVVVYDGTRLTSATGITMTGGTGLSVTGTVAASGGFFIAGNSVISSITSNTVSYGAITINSAASVGGTSYFSNTSSTVTLNYPGTGITGTGVATQIPYYNASSTLTGDVGLIYSRTAASGNGLSVNINSATGNIFKLDTPLAMTAGNLIDADINGVQRFGVDWKGMTTLTASASGNTALIVSGGRTILSAATANYSTVNLPSSSGTNPGSGNTAIGDLWFNGTNLYFRKDATTSFDLLVGSVSGSGLADRVAKWSSGSGLTYSNLSESTAGVGMTLTSLGSIGAGGGTTALLTLQTIVGDNSAVDRYFVRGVTSTGTKLFSVDTSGNLRATTKSFDIPHPTKEGMRLVYGVLEGPEHGVYHRGTVEGNGVIQINLPEYWHKLVGDQYTIQLTPWGNYNVCINSKTENYFTIQLVGDFISRKYKNIKVDYIVHGSRLDAPLETEQ